MQSVVLKFDSNYATVQGCFDRLAEPVEEAGGKGLPLRRAGEFRGIP